MSDDRRDGSKHGDRSRRLGDDSQFKKFKYNSQDKFIFFMLVGGRRSHFLGLVKQGLKMAKQSKRYREMIKKVPEAAVPVAKAVEIIKGFGGAKFDQTVEIHMHLGIDAKQADQLVRGSLVLPHGIGKSQRVVVFAKGDAAAAALAAGADVVGQEDLSKRIQGGWMEFDVCVASPDMMGLVGPLGRVLGPRGLMPSPRAGTVTPDVATAVREYKAGKVEFRNDSGGNVHAVVGRMSFEGKQLEDNINAFIEFVVNLKPNSIKGVYVKSISIAGTMSPGIQIAA